MKINKSIILTGLLFMAIVTISNAQWSFGVKGGANFSHAQVVGLDFGIRPDVNWISGGFAGVTGEYQFNKDFSLMTELNYIEKGFITAADFDLNIAEIEIPIGVKAKTQLRYIDVPIILKYRVFTGPKASVYVSGGGYFGYGINGTLRTKARVLVDLNLTKTALNLSNDNFDRTEFGGVIGGGIELPVKNGKFIIDGRYSHAYNPMLDDFLIDIKLRNRGFSLGLGYTYNFSVQKV